MNHSNLLRQKYDPLDIKEDVRKKASNEHRQFLNAFERISQSPTDFSLKVSLLKKASQLIYVVRSNIAHSEKTPHGPDFAKLERDRLVSELTANVIEEVFDILFDGPSDRLVAYGTLMPDGANAYQLAGLEGQWREGKVNGKVEEHDGLKEFVWTVGPEVVSVMVVTAPKLNEHISRNYGGHPLTLICWRVLVGFVH